MEKICIFNPASWGLNTIEGIVDFYCPQCEKILVSIKIPDKKCSISKMA